MTRKHLDAPKAAGNYQGQRGLLPGAPTWPSTLTPPPPEAGVVLKLGAGCAGTLTEMSVCATETPGNTLSFVREVRYSQQDAGNAWMVPTGAPPLVLRQEASSAGSKLPGRWSAPPWRGRRPVPPVPLTSSAHSSHGSGGLQMWQLQVPEGALAGSRVRGAKGVPTIPPGIPSHRYRRVTTEQWAAAAKMSRAKPAPNAVRKLIVNPLCRGSR